MTGSAYFSTMLGKFAKLPTSPRGVYHQVDGIWNITHSSVLSPYFQRGKQHKFVNRTGLKWTQVRAHLKRLFLDNSIDNSIIRRIQLKVIDYIPLRSGRLADTIFNSMYIWRGSYYSTHYLAIFTFRWSTKRPRPIPGNVRHAPPQTGYGEWGTYRVINALVRSRVRIHHITAGGNALYFLNDSQAYSEPTSKIDKISSDILEDEFAERFNIILTLFVY